MLPLWALMAAGGAGLGVLKSEMIDRPAAQRQRKVEATKALWSPWTGMQAQNVQDPNPLADALSGGMGLGMLGANIDASQSQQGLLDAQKKYFEGMTPQAQPQQTTMLTDPWTNKLPVAGPEKPPVKVAATIGGGVPKIKTPVLPPGASVVVPTMDAAGNMVYPAVQTGNPYLPR